MKSLYRSYIDDDLNVFSANLTKYDFSDYNPHDESLITLWDVSVSFAESLKLRSNGSTLDNWLNRTKAPSPKIRLKFRFPCSKIVTHYYIKCMIKKKNVADKVLSIRVPTELFDKFKTLCDQNYKTMSDTLRDFIRDYAKQGNK